MTITNAPLETAVRNTSYTYVLYVEYALLVVNNNGTVSVLI